jgi:hypothetical protein
MELLQDVLSTLRLLTQLLWPAFYFWLGSREAWDACACGQALRMHVARPPGLATCILGWVASGLDDSAGA